VEENFSTKSLSVRKLFQMYRLSKTSALSVLAATFVAVVAPLPTTAKAADDCLASPIGAAPNGRHWYYQVNRASHQKCWFLGTKRQTIRSDVLQRSSDAANQDRDRTSRVGKSVRAQLPAPTKKISSLLPPSIADARASVEDTVNEATAPNRIASSEAGVAKEVTYDDLLRSTFGSRWKDPFDTTRTSSFQSSPSRDSGLHQPSTAVAGLEARSSVATDHLVAIDLSPSDVLAVFLAAAGSALVLLGLFGRLFLFQGAQSPTLEYPAPLRLPSFESTLEDLIHANALGDLDASVERDRYGIPFTTLQVRRSTKRAFNPIAKTHFGASAS
jgi:hypothetical protein